MNQEIKSSSSMSLKERLQRMVWYRLLFLVGTGILLFATGMYLTIEVSNRKNLEENRKLFESAFLQVYDSSKSFLTGNELMETCRRCLLYDAAPLNLRYLLYNQNASSPVNADLILTDKGRNVIYNSFQNGEWNQYRKSFNRAVCDNTFAHAEKDVYLSVYYLSGMSSELVLATPVMIDGTPQGYVSLYLHGADWGTLLSVSNFEGVITDYAGRVIYSSRHSFIQDINRFVLNGHWTVMLDENRYEVSARSLLDGQVVVYSLVYDPPNRSLFLIGTLLILLSGAFWFLIARSMTAVMAAENAASVKTLISEMDIIENQDPLYRVSLDTDEEFARVGSKINHMLDSIQELHRQNTELIQLKQAAEINQLTAQFNPHFLYNTLESLRSGMLLEPQKADRLILSLTRILRYSIDDHKEEVLLSEDLTYLNGYLEILKYRFGERFQYELFLEDECLNCLVPKLLLQPIIENSIKYGFQNQMELHVWVDGYVQDQVLNLSVTDDGVGMAEQDLEQLNATILQSDSAHKGLRSIARRLFLQYGEGSGIALRNIKTDGLQVMVRIVCPKEDEDGWKQMK